MSHLIRSLVSFFLVLVLRSFSDLPARPNAPAFLDASSYLGESMRWSPAQKTYS